MLDLIAALGLALAVEGILFAAFPEGCGAPCMRPRIRRSERMRVVGIVSAVIGVAIVWGIRQLGREIEPRFRRNRCLNERDV